MSNFRFIAGVLISAWVGSLAGCVPPSPAAPPPLPDQTPASAGGVATEPSLSLPPPPPPPPNDQAEPRGVIALKDALSAALAGNLELLAFSWDLRASDARVVQAGLLPNPEFAVNPENFVGSGVYRNQVQFQNTLQLSQLIELGDKRARRTEAAERTRDRMSVEYEAKRVEVLGATTLDFIAVVSDQERLKLAGLATGQATELLHAVRRRISAGIGSTLEEKRAEVQLARTRVAERHAEHQLLASKQNLAARWGGKSPLFSETRGELFTTHPVPPLEVLLGRLEAAPERRAAVAEEKVLAAEAALARTKQTSDVTVGVAWRHGRSWEDQSTLAFFSVPLQVFNRYQGDVTAAVALRQKGKSSTSAIETRLRAVLFGLYQEIVHAQAEVEVMKEEILPRSEESLALARNGFAQGLFTQLDLLDAQRTLIEVRSGYIQAGTTYHELLAEVERLLGEPLHPLTETRGMTP